MHISPAYQALSFIANFSESEAVLVHGKNAVQALYRINFNLAGAV